jgi:hypothetical protein
MTSESVVFCEGFHDRAFWKGLLLHLNCTDPGIVPGASTRGTIKDPFGGDVVGGRFAYSSPAGPFIQVIPCHGKGNILRNVRIRLSRPSTEPVRHMIINDDADVPEGTPNRPTPGAILSTLQKIDPGARQVGPAAWRMFGGNTDVALTQWAAPDPPTDGVPKIQTLERLVCASVCAAHAGRGAAVKTWLDSRPTPPADNVKDYAWSYMAGWNSGDGCAEFYSGLWSDPAIAAELEKRLRSSGGWAVAEALLG